MPNMYGGNYRPYNPYGGYYTAPQTQTAPQQPQIQQNILRVNGANGANAIQLRPNSSVLAIDDTQPVVWLAKTDGAGYKTVTPYAITPVQDAKDTKIQQMETEIAELRQIVEEIKNEQSNVRQSKRSAKSGTADTANADTNAGQ